MALRSQAQIVVTLDADGQHLPDEMEVLVKPITAYRAIKTDVLRNLTSYRDQFHTSDLLIEALKKGARVIEVPITIKKRQSGVSKKPMSLRYGWGFTRAILGTWLR